MKNKILIIVGTRPNFIKVTQFKKVNQQENLDLDIKIVHTGQHYDYKMSEVFFEQFQMKPDFFLESSKTSPVSQMASIMVALEELIESKFKPDLIIVPGDVNSTLAAALVANKKGIKLAHLESGLRSFDMDMPEEWNRILVDKMSDIYFVTENSGVEILQKNENEDKIHFVGNTMIDTMVAYEEEIQSSVVLDKFNLKEDNFVLMTIHRPSNVDSLKGIETLLSLLKYLDNKIKVIFPIHPRTFNRIKEFGFENELGALSNLILSEPLSYFDFQKLVASCKCVLTDSGGIQEETTFRKKPCLTLRENTERPVTVSEGTNTLIPFKFDIIQDHLQDIFSGEYKKGAIPNLWDGNSTQRILDVISKKIF